MKFTDQDIGLINDELNEAGHVIISSKLFDRLAAVARETLADDDPLVDELELPYSPDRKIAHALRNIEAQVSFSRQ